MDKHSGAFKPRHVVRPVVHHARTRRRLPTTWHNKSGTHHHEVLVTIILEGEDYTLELRLNHDLLPEGHTISYQEGGRRVLHRPKREELNLCQYTGHVRGKLNSWVAVSTCHGIRGAIHDGTKIRFIEPVEGNDIQTLHHVYEYSGDIEKEFQCAYEAQGPRGRTAKDLLIQTRRNNSRRRKKRDDSLSNRGFFNANERSRYVELVLVADHAQYLGAKRNLRLLHHQLQETTNIVNAMFSPHNIFIALTGVEVWTTEDRIILEPNNEKLLEPFSDYLTDLLRNIGNYDHAQLLTETEFSQGYFGFTYMESMCSLGSCAIIHRSARNVTVASIVRSAYNMAHELGHSFGMRHDSGECYCQDHFCIMHEQEQGYLPTRWSDCSLSVLSKVFADSPTFSCLRNKPVRLFGSPSCGNGFIDPGEECDCGVTINDDPNACYVCCNPETCRLKFNATCLKGPCCNLQKCQFKPAGTICRAAELDCDLPEYCNGLSEDCPEDTFKSDAVSCTGKILTSLKGVDNLMRQMTRHQSEDCLANCSGHGICNSNGHCHCDDGFAPPMCDVPGVGGSVDSGPARPLESQNCPCNHGVTPASTSLIGRSYVSQDRDTYVTALGSITVIISIVFLICLIKFKINSLFRKNEDWKSSHSGIYKNFGTSRSTVSSIGSGKNEVSIKKDSDVMFIQPKIVITPEMLSSVHLKKVENKKI